MIDWENRCHQCGLCCCHKTNNEYGEIVYTGKACDFLDILTMKCKVYRERKEYNPACIELTEEYVKGIDWLPESCGYK